MGRKSASKGKRVKLTDFSHLLTKAEEVNENEIKEVELKED